MPPTRHTLFDNPVARAPRLRRPPTSEYKYVRKVGGGAWQARVWLGARHGGSLNLGLFTIAQHPADYGRPEDEIAEWTAARASRAFGKFYDRTKTDRGLRQTLEHLKGKGFVPADVLPPRVYAVPGGYAAKVRVRGTALEVDRVFACPWECYESMCAKLSGLFPAEPSRSEIKARERERRARALAAKVGRRYQGGVLTDFAA